MGTSRCAAVRVMTLQDHPHAYGDKVPTCERLTKCRGSSPRVWGQGLCSIADELRLRIIPTRMGTSYRKIKVKKGKSGSSPRVWGQVCHTDIIYLRNRIIPTRMGTSLGHIKLIDSFGDHPHAYGDKYPIKKFCPKSKGSSPRVWGQDNRLWRGKCNGGIIPTRMGTRRKHDTQYR